MLKSDSALKKSVDYVLCSVCHINPEYFSQLLIWMGVIVNGEVSMTASVCDDRKDGGLHQECLTDDSKEANSIQRQQSMDTSSPVVDLPVPGFRHIVLEEAHLSTLSLACKSPVAIKQLLDSGFPAVLAQGLFEFCSKVMSHLTDGFVNLEGLTDTSKTMNDDAQHSSSYSKANGNDGNDTGTKFVFIGVTSTSCCSSLMPTANHMLTSSSTSYICLLKVVMVGVNTYS